MALTDIQIHELYPEQLAANELAKSLLSELQAIQPKLHAAQEAQLTASEELSKLRQHHATLEAEALAKVNQAAREVKALEHEFQQKTEKRNFVKQQYNERNEEIQRIEAAKVVTPAE